MSQDDEYRAVSAVIAAYARALDHRDWDAAKQLFAVDAVAYGDAYVGPEAIVNRNMRRLTPAGPTMHLLGSQTIQIDGNIATAITQVRAFHIGAGIHEGKTYEVMGEYHDELARTRQGWRFARRRFDRRIFVGDPEILGQL